MRGRQVNCTGGVDECRERVLVLADLELADDRRPRIAAGEQQVDEDACAPRSSVVIEVGVVGGACGGDLVVEVIGVQFGRVADFEVPLLSQIPSDVRCPRDLADGVGDFGARWGLLSKPSGLS